MRTDKGKAFVMRRAGKSYREISSELGMSTSTLTNWFKGVDFSEAIREELTKQAKKFSSEHIRELNKVRGVALRVWYSQAEDEAKRELHKYKNNPLFIAALSAYWGEGDKATKYYVRLANTDPKMLHVFLIFLLEICKVPKEKISLALYLYTDLDEQKCKRYWSRHVGIKKFHKTQILPSRHKNKRLPYGTASIVLTSSYLKRKLTIWIDQLPEMVLNKAPKK